MWPVPFICFRFALNETLNCRNDELIWTIHCFALWNDFSNIVRQDCYIQYTCIDHWYKIASLGWENPRNPRKCSMLDPRHHWPAGMAPNSLRRPSVQTMEPAQPPALMSSWLLLWSLPVKQLISISCGTGSGPLPKATFQVSRKRGSSLGEEVNNFPVLLCSSSKTAAFLLSCWAKSSWAKRTLHAAGHRWSQGCSHSAVLQKHNPAAECDTECLRISAFIVQIKTGLFPL